MQGWWRRFGLASVLAAVAMVASNPARAEFGGYIAGGLGVFDALHNNTAGEGRLEFRFDQSLFYIRPLVGTLFTNKGSVYAYGGFRFELPIGKHVLILPNAAVGYYEKGDGKDLGSHFEFKTGVEVDLVFANGIRVGPAFDHISNAGITKRNPGEENFMLMVSIPLGMVSLP